MASCSRGTGEAIQGLPAARGPAAPSWLRRAGSAALVLVLVLVGVLGFIVAFAGVTLPSINTLSAFTGSVRILDRHGAVIAQIGLGAAPRETVTLAQVSPFMQDAIIAAEDRGFYTEGALDPPAIGRALIVDLVRGRAAQGASTITQQLARNAFLRDDTSPLRKLREALLADQIEQRFTKQQVLAMYLNTIYFGHGAYGIEEAAQTYFGVHAKQLNLAQSALIAGLPQAPSLDDLYVDPAVSFARMHYVLGEMAAAGMVSAAQAAAVDPLVGDGTTQGTTPTLVAERARHQAALLRSLHDTFNGSQADLAPHFVTYVRDQLYQLFQNDPAALDSVTTVQTSLDLSLQQRAQESVTKGVAAIGRNANNGALLMLDAHSGDILAMVGSANYDDTAIAGEFNVVTAQRQPGSSFKPFVYEQAFREGVVSPWSTVDDTQQESQQLGGVQDWDGSFMGPMPAWQALLLSRNVPTEQVMERAGTHNVIDFAHSLGISTPLADNASTGIGTSAVRMLDQAAAYAAFADGGTTVQPRAILSVSDSAGHLLYQQPASRGNPVMSPQQAYLVTSILRQYNAQWGDGITRDVACKSGTTTGFVDAWFMAYTPDWVVATWAGHTDGANPAEVGMNTVYGNDTGQQIAAPFINGLPSSAAFTPPPGSPSFSTEPPQPPPGPAGPAPRKHHHHG